MSKGNQRMLVTGGAGFVGSHLCEQLLEQGYQVSALDTGPAEKVEHLLAHPNFELISGSVLDPELVDRLVDSSDMVFHLAAIADPRRYGREPLRVLDLNIKGTLNVLDSCSRRSTKVVYTSTSEIYGRNPKVPWKEDDDRVLGATGVNRWCYSSSKAVCEHYCFAYRQERAVPFVIVRLFNAYGPRIDAVGAGRVIPIFLGQYLSGESVTIHGDGTQTRCFTYVADVVEGMILAAFAKQAEGEVFNLGTSTETTIRELAEAIREVGGFDSETVYLPHSSLYGDSYEDIPRRVPDIAKAKRILGWEPKTSLRDGLVETIKYFRNRVDREKGVSRKSIA